jgi:Kef-type K+ transport system membrane component KefB
MSYTGFVLITLIAVAAPVIRELLPQLLVPAVVLEIVACIVLGPHGLDVLSFDSAIKVFSDIGLAALLFLAGREIDLHRLRGTRLRRALVSFAFAFVLATALGVGLHAAGLVKTPMLIAVALVATSLSIIIVPLKDARETGTDFGQSVIAAASVAEFGAIVLLSFMFAGNQEGFGSDALHLGLFALVAVFIGLVSLRPRALTPLSEAITRLEDTTAQIRVRAEFAYVAAAVALASVLGLEAVLAAFTVGVLRGLVSPEGDQSSNKLDVVSFGIFVPFFFVSSGMAFDVGALVHSGDALLLLPIFVAGLLLSHLIPALILGRGGPGRLNLASGLLQGTSLTFLVVVTQLGLRLDIMRPGTAAALVAAGLVSVMAFPAIALALMRSEEPGLAESPAG